MALQFVPPQYLPTDRNGHLVIANERGYHITKKTELDNVAFGLPVNLGEWRYNLICCHAPSCRATARIEYNEFNDTYANFSMMPGKVHEDDCPWDVSGICVEYFKQELYKKLKSGEYSSVAAAHKWAEDAFAVFYPDYRMWFPPLKFFKSKGNILLQERFPPLPNLAQLVNLVIPERLQLTLSGQLFLLFQHSFLHPPCARFPLGRWETMIVYCTAARFRDFCAAGVIFADGTFGMCPEPFAQIHISHVPVGNRVRACVFALLTRKTEFMYTRLFERLRDLAVERNHPMQVKKFRCDFETAQMNAAVKTYFPALSAEQLETVVSGCFFHLCSAIYRRAMELGLSIAYRNPLTQVKTYIKMCMALAFLPVGDMHFTFGEIMHEYNTLPPLVPPRPDLAEFFNYFHTNWILGGVASRGRWCMWEFNSRRTTNDCETYHSQLKRAIGAKLNIWHFLEKLQGEEKRIGIDIERILSGQIYRGKPRYVQMNITLRQYKNDFMNGDLTRLAYVRAIAHLMPK